MSTVRAVSREAPQADKGFSEELEVWRFVDSILRDRGLSRLSFVQCSGVFDQNEKWYTLDEVAKTFKVNKATVNRWIREEGLKTWKIGEVVRIRQGWLNEFTEGRNRG